MVALIAAQLGTHIHSLRAPLSVFMAVATVLEKSLRPLGLQPPLHRRRMDFFKKSFVLSHEKASKRLGFAPEVSFREGVKATAMWYRSMGYLA
jgi:nucleoside-diphosphate-sugar epimerase